MVEITTKNLRELIRIDMKFHIIIEYTSTNTMVEIFFLEIKLLRDGSIIEIPLNNSENYIIVNFFKFHHILKVCSQ